MKRIGWTALFFLAACSSAPQYDLVLSGGRVIDPATGLDAVRNVGILGGSIAAVSTEPLAGRRVVDVGGLVVAPGFIDLHQHQQDLAAYRLKAQDGVTSALEMESGVPDLPAFLEARRGGTPINYGATVSQEAARVRAWGLALDTSQMGPAAAIDDPASGPATDDPPTAAQLERLIGVLRTGLDAGALGVGMGLEYTPGATFEEVLQMFRLAAEYGRGVYVHLRGESGGSSLPAVEEMIAASDSTGAPVHVVHINSSCLAEAFDCLELIAKARAAGQDVTTEAYPYGAGMTSIASALFNPGWRERRGIDYSDLELPATGERLTKARFDELHDAAKPEYVLIHMNPDSLVDAIVASDLTMIASDGLPSHPRGAGSYARVLRRQVRELGLMSLPDAIRQMSLLPAMRLESATAAAGRKGRVQEGADADLVVFDPATVTDRSTYAAPQLPSEGFRFVIVAGTPVVDEGRLVETALPGRAIVADPR
ncbi:MAG: amidohydrolase family protein [Gemmatimonadales bacterium]